MKVISNYLQTEVVLDVLPALVVLLVQLVAGLLPPLGDGQLQGGLEHEGLGALRHLDGAQLHAAPVLETFGVWTVGRHHGVEGGSPGTESLLLGLVPTVSHHHHHHHHHQHQHRHLLAQDETHELGHAVAVIVGRPEGVLSWDTNYQIIILSY